VQAVASLGEECSHEIALTGKLPWATAELRQAITAAGMRRRVHFLGYVADADLPALYSAADLFVNVASSSPTGLGAMEAAACGTPPLTPAAGFSPYDVDAIASQIRRALTEPARAETLIQQERERMLGRDWERVARVTVRAYTLAAGLEAEELTE